VPRIKINGKTYKASVLFWIYFKLTSMCKSKPFEVLFKIRSRKPLHHNGPFLLLTSTPVFLGLYLFYVFAEGYHFSTDAEAIKNFHDISSIPLLLVALGGSLGVMVGRFHATSQTVEKLDVEQSIYFKNLIEGNLKRIQGAFTKENEQWVVSTPSGDISKDFSHWSLVADCMKDIYCYYDYVNIFMVQLELYQLLERFYKYFNDLISSLGVESESGVTFYKKHLLHDWASPEERAKNVIEFLIAYNALGKKINKKSGMNSSLTLLMLSSNTLIKDLLANLTKDSSQEPSQ
jgi:hypothetical protein